MPRREGSFFAWHLQETPMQNINKTKTVFRQPRNITFDDITLWDVRYLTNNNKYYIQWFKVRGVIFPLAITLDFDRRIKQDERKWMCLYKFQQRTPQMINAKRFSKKELWAFTIISKKGVKQ